MGRSTTADNTSLGATRRHRCPRVRHRSDRQSDYVDVTIQQFAQVKHSVCFVLRALTYNIVSSIESSDLPSTSTLYPTTVSTSQPSVSHNTSHSLSPGVIGGIVAGVLSVLLVVTVALLAPLPHSFYVKFDGAYRRQQDDRAATILRPSDSTGRHRRRRTADGRSRRL